MVRFCLYVLLVLPLRAQTVAEQYLLAAINQDRVAHLLGAVQIDPALGRAAALHAEAMAQYGKISHQFTGEAELATRGSEAGARFDRITENVAEGPSAVDLHDALMRSPGHRANILDPAVNVIGICVIRRDGQLYAVEDFAHAVPTLSLDQQEEAVSLLLDQAGLIVTPNETARRTCEQANGYNGNERPSYVMRYTTANLNQLPAALARRLHSGREHRAAVGACPPETSYFTQYRLVVLLFP